MIQRKKVGHRSFNMVGLIFIMFIFTLVGAIILESLWRDWQQEEANYYEAITTTAEVKKEGNALKDIRVQQVEEEAMQDQTIDASSEKAFIEVPYIDQMNGYPTGCEIVSATMVLQYYGFHISVDEFIDNYLKMDFLEEYEGEIWGKNPKDAFIGDPRSIYSYGCYAPVIEDSLNLIVQEDMEVKNTTGTSIETLVSDYINNEMPVMIWATMDLIETYPSTQWKLRGSGEDYQWKANEHCMVLVGYDETSYYFNDPYNNNGVIAYDKNIVELRYNEMGNQSVVLIPK